MISAAPNLSSGNPGVSRVCKALVRYRDTTLARRYHAAVKSEVRKRYRTVMRKARLYKRLHEDFQRDLAANKSAITRHRIFGLLNAATAALADVVPASMVTRSVQKHGGIVLKELWEWYRADKKARTYLNAVSGDVMASAKIAAEAIANTTTRALAKSLLNLYSMRDTWKKKTAKVERAEVVLWKAKNRVAVAVRDAYHKLFNLRRELKKLRPDYTKNVRAIREINRIRSTIDKFCHVDPDYLAGRWYAKGRDGYDIVIGKGAGNSAGASGRFTQKRGRWRLFNNSFKFRNLRHRSHSTWTAQELSAYRRAGKLGTRWSNCTIELDKPNIMRIKARGKRYRLYRR